MIYSTRAASKLAGGVAKVQPMILKGTGVLLLFAGLFLTVRDTLGMLG
jgi:hypothetical protein